MAESTSSFNWGSFLGKALDTAGAVAQAKLTAQAAQQTQLPSASAATQAMPPATAVPTAQPTTAPAVQAASGMPKWLPFAGLGGLVVILLGALLLRRR